MSCPAILQRMSDGEKLNKWTLLFDEMEFRFINTEAFYQSFLA